MNEQEAIRKLGVYASVNGSGLCTQDEYEEAKRMAIESLEKQIPKKVKNFPHFSIHTRPMFFYITHCPVCDHVIDEYEDNHIYPRTRNEWCNKCGQHIDWTVEE